MANMEPLVLGVRVEAEGLEEFDAVDHALKKQKKAVSDTLKRLKDYKETVGMTADQLQIYKMRQNDATEAQIKEAIELQNLINIEKKKIASSNRLNGSLRLVRGGAGQLGHQFQDIAVQLQGGTDAMIVFGQQGSQIASLMGPGGAMIGAFLAIGAAIYTTFKNVEVAESKFSELQTTLEGLTPATDAVAGRLKTTLELLKEAQIETARTELAKLVKSMGDGVQDAEKFATAQDALNDAQATDIRQKVAMARGSKIAGKNARDETLAAGGLSAAMLEQISIIEKLGGTIDSELLDPALLTRLRELQSEFGQGTGDGIKVFEPESVTEAKKGIQEIEDSLLSKRGKIQKEYDDLRTALVDNFTKTGQIGSERFMRLYREINAAQTAAIAEMDKREADQAAREQARADAKAKAAERAAQREIDAKARAVSTLEALQRSDVTDIDKINKRYDAELDRARQAARDRVDLAKMLADTEVAIEAKRSAAIQALRDKDKQKHFDNIVSLRDAAIEGFGTETEQYISNLMKRQQALEEAKAAEAITKAEYDRYSMHLEEMKAEHMLDQQLKIIGGLQNVENAITNASHAFITGAANGTEAVRMLGRAVMDELIKSIVQMGIEKAKQAVIAKNIEAGSLSASVAANAAAMKVIAAASYPAAALVSLATSGGNAAGASAGIGTVTATAKGVSMIGFEGGGFTGNGARSGGMDGRGGFLAMLHPNETVIDHTKGQGQGITIVNNIQTSGDGDVDQKIAAAVTEASQQTVQQVHNMMRRGRM